MVKYKKSTIDHAIYIKVLSNVTVSYLTLSTGGVFNNNNKKKEFPELKRVFEEAFGIKVQEGYVLKYLYFQIFQSLIGFSFYHNDHIIEIVNKCFPAGKFRQVDKTFMTDSTY